MSDFVTGYDPTAASGAARSSLIVGLLSDALDLLSESDERARACIEQAVVVAGGVASGHGHGGLAPWQVKRVSEYIENKLSDHIRIEQAAALVRLSANYFSRAFKATFGLPFSQCVIARRVERAKLLLSTTNEPISEIASACGFSDQAHMCRLVRRNLGTTPAGWRRRFGPTSARTSSAAVR